MNEETITIDLQQLVQVLEQLENVNVNLPDENVETLENIETSIFEIKEIIEPEVLTEEQLQEIETLKLEEQDFNSSIESNLIDLNNNIISLTTIIEEDINTYNELDELQIKAYGSNIILLFLVVFALFSKFVVSIFKFFGNKI